MQRRMNRLKLLSAFEINMKTTIIIMFWILLTVPALAQPDNRPSVATVEMEGWFIEAKKEVLLENYEEALAIYLSILKKDKKNATALYELAKVYEKLGRRVDAKSNAKKAFENDPTIEWYGLYYADFLKEDGDWKTAADVYSAVIQANPQKVEYYYEKAYFLLMFKDVEAALEVYDLLEQQIGVDERASQQKHRIYDIMGNTSEAVKALEDLITAFPTESQYYHNLAQYFESKGKISQAQEVYKRALKVNPEDPVASIAIAENQKSEGNEAAYLTGLQPLFSKSEVGIDVKVKELYPYISKLPDLEPSVSAALLELSKTMTVAHPTNPKAFAIYADILYYSGNPTEALKQYKKTLELDNSVYSVWEQTLIAAEALGLFEELVTISENAMDYFPNQSFIFLMNGVGNNRVGAYEDAIDALEQAMMMSGRDEAMQVKVYAETGVSYFWLGNAESFNDNFESALAIDADNVMTLNNYSYYLALQGNDLAKAEALIKKANGLVVNHPTILDTYGFVLYQKQAYEDAEKWLKKALNNGGDSNAGTLEHYGDVLYRLNRVEEAVTYWQKAKEKGADSSEIDSKITERKIAE